MPGPAFPGEMSSILGISIQVLVLSLSLFPYLSTSLHFCLLFWLPLASFYKQADSILGEEGQ